MSRPLSGKVPVLELTVIQEDVLAVIQACDRNGDMATPDRIQNQTGYGRETVTTAIATLLEKRLVRSALPGTW